MAGHLAVMFTSCQLLLSGKHQRVPVKPSSVACCSTRRCGSVWWATMSTSFQLLLFGKHRESLANPAHCLLFHPSHNLGGRDPEPKP